MAAASTGAGGPSGTTAQTAPDSERARDLREALTDKLTATGMITSPVVERAFRVVRRHLFVPAGTALEAAYSAEESVTVKRDRDGVIISTVSAPYIQARMIEQAGLRPGMSVLEIGSNGCNAALLAEVVGPGGRVVSVDIDPEVTDHARDRLAAAGYADRVTVVRADAEHRVSGLDAPVEAVLVTAGAWDVSPAWLDQLAAGGTLVVPLRLNGVTRTIGFRREGDHLVSTSAEAAGFVPMQGAGGRDERVFLLPDGRGHHVRLRFDGDVPVSMRRLDRVLATRPVDVWSGVTIRHGVSFADLHLWLACFLPGFCGLAADEGTELAADRKRWFPFGAVAGDSFAFLAVRPALDGAGVEFGGRAYGPQGQDAAAALVDQVQAWNRHARHAASPTFAYWPAGSQHPPAAIGMAVLAKTHGAVTVSWPTTA